MLVSNKIKLKYLTRKSSAGHQAKKEERREKKVSNKIEFTESKAQQKESTTLCINLAD
jgi:hypothetical protein